MTIIIQGTRTANGIDPLSRASSKFIVRRIDPRIDREEGNAYSNAIVMIQSIEDERP